MPFNIELTGTSAEVTAAVNALTVPASEGAVAQQQLAAAKVYITGQISGSPMLAIGPLRLLAFGIGSINGSNFRVDVHRVRLTSGNQQIEPPPN